MQLASPCTGSMKVAWSFNLHPSILDFRPEQPVVQGIGAVIYEMNLRIALFNVLGLLELYILDTFFLK